MASIRSKRHDAKRNKSKNTVIDRTILRGHRDILESLAACNAVGEIAGRNNRLWIERIHFWTWLRPKLDQYT